MICSMCKYMRQKCDGCIAFQRRQERDALNAFFAAMKGGFLRINETKETHK